MICRVKENALFGVFWSTVRVDTDKAEDEASVLVSVVQSCIS
jgi:hypothetical protein